MKWKGDWKNSLLCKEMNEKMTALKRVDVMIAIRKEAEQDLVNLRRLCGKAIWEDNTELNYMWHFGYEGNVGARTYRVLVPLRLAVHVFEKADVDHFLEYGTVRCRMAELPQVSSLRAATTTAWRKEWNDWKKMGIVEEDRVVLEVKAVELALDYTKHMTRFQLHRPNLTRVPRQQWFRRAKEMLKMWTKVMKSSKRAQMQTEEPRDWPPGEMRPWPFDSFLGYTSGLLDHRATAPRGDSCEDRAIGLFGYASCDHLEVGAACWSSWGL